MTTPKIEKKGKIFEGIVVSDKMKDTIVISMEHTRQHPKYKKILSRRKKIYVQNNLNAKIGQKVRVIETKPISKLKCFITLEIIK